MILSLCTQDIDRSMAAPADRRQRKQLREELLAMLSHYELMRGLALISEIRQVRYLNLLGEERSKGRTGDEALRTVRQATREQMTINPKGRVFFDAERELDLYAWGPMQLFFCIAWAFLDRYRYLRDRHSDLVCDDLDRYIEENRAGLDATRTVRNWVLHPGIRRHPDDAMAMLFSVRDGWRTAYPVDIVNRLVELAEKFLEQLNERAG